jgi:hypothetical protein
VAAAALTAITALGASGSVRADSGSPAVAFDGSAAASGVRIQLSIPGFPLTDTPLDGGGPAAQVAVNTIGSSNSYAAFPDPGPLVNSVPGVLTGLLGLGAAGLPPIHLPSVPPYPLSVSTDASGNADKSLGAGPYNLAAHSTAASASASATGGLQTGLLGNAALVTSTASLTTSTSGTVVSTATSDLQGLTIGPLTLGEVKSTATETLTPDGTMTPSTSFQIFGVQIGGLPVGLNQQGLSLAGVTVPLPIGSTLTHLLGASHVNVELIGAQQFPDRVLAPALRITAPFAMPFKIPGVGQFSGTMTLTVGSATASMKGAATSAGTGADSSGAAGSGIAQGGSTGGSDSAGGPVPSGASMPASDAGMGQAPGVGPASSAAPVLAAPTGRSNNRGSAITAAPAGLFGSFDIRSMYLLLSVCAVAAGGLIHLIRLMGVRKPWTSGNG